MKRSLLMMSVALLLAAAWPGHAQPGPQGGRRMDVPTQPMPPQPPQRDFRGDPRNRDVQDARRNAMTPDERRQLRRDIGDHGRDLYRDRQPKR